MLDYEHVKNFLTIPKRFAMLRYRNDSEVALMKNIVSLAAAGCTLMMMLGAAAQAQESDLSSSQQIMMPVPKISITFKPLNTMSVVGSEIKSFAYIRPDSSAPPLTQDEVFAVGSSQYGGWEYMTSPTQASTVNDHGGALLRVVIRELGYGNHQVVYMG